MDMLDFFHHSVDDSTTSQLQVAEIQDAPAPKVYKGHQKEEEDIDLDEDAVLLTEAAYR